MKKRKPVANIPVRDVKPGKYFNEVKSLPGSSTQAGETRILFFRRTDRASPVVKNGMQAIKAIAYGWVQGKEGTRWKHVKFHKACTVHLFASTPVQVQKRKFDRSKYNSKSDS